MSCTPFAHDFWLQYGKKTELLVEIAPLSLYNAKDASIKETLSYMFSFMYM